MGRLPETSIGGRDERFPDTRWTLIRNAMEGPTGGGDLRARLDELIRQYWKPVYAHIRRAFAVPPEDAKDLTQDFFARLLDGTFLAKADPDRGSFRAFLRTAVRNYVTDQIRRGSALKRNAGPAVVSLENADIEPVLRDHAAATPEELFDRVWAATVLDLAKRRLLETLRRDGKEKQAGLFEAFYLDAPAGSPPGYEELGRRTGLSGSDIANLLHDGRRRFREIIEQIVRDYVSSAEDVRDEIDRLF